MSRLTKLLDREQVKASLSFGGGYTGVNAFAPQWDSVWSSASNGVKESIPHGFEGYVQQAYQANGIVFACVQARAMPFSEARFLFQRIEEGRPTDLYGSPALSILDRPWPNATTGELLWRMEQDISLAGNHFLTVRQGRRGPRLRRLRPDWMTIVSGVEGDTDASAWDVDSEVLGYIYEPRDSSGRKVEPVVFSVDQVVHHSVVPDPLAQWRGMSWLTPILREIEADGAATQHKLNFFRNGGTPGMVIKWPAAKGADEVARLKELFDANISGVRNAYKALHLGGGADVTVAGVDLKQLDFKMVQGGGETRIAAAAGVGPIIARLSEGLQGSALNAGNFSAAARQVADTTLRPLWRMAAASLSKLVEVPDDSRLWYDARDVSLLHESVTDEADVLTKNAAAVRTLVDAGFAADAAIRAVDTGDISLLTGTHSGLFSVQLQAPGSGEDGDSAKASRQLALVEALQKIYLAVGTVITEAEARQILNTGYGAQLSGPGPTEGAP